MNRFARIRVLLCVCVLVLGATGAAQASLPTEFYLNGWVTQHGSLDGRYFRPLANQAEAEAAFAGYDPQNLYGRVTADGAWDGQTVIFWNPTEGAWQYSGPSGDEIILQGGSSSELFVSLSQGNAGQIYTGAAYSSELNFPGGMGFDPLRMSWGFSIGMLFWVAVFAVWIPIKWVKDISAWAS